MDLEINIATRIIILSILGYILVRILITFIYSGISPRRKKNKYDLDQLIRNKQELLRSKSGIKASTSQGDDGKVYKYPEERVYCGRLKQINTQDHKEEFLELQKILEIFDAAKWGQGAAFGALADKFASLTRFKIDQSLISRAVNKLSQEGWFLKLNSENLPHLIDIQNLILNYILHLIAFEELESGNYSLLNTLSKQGLMPSACFEKAVRKNQNESWENILFEDKRLSVVKPTSTIKKWQDQAQVFYALIPLVKPQKGDLKTIYAIFNLPENASMDSIKKKYKSLAQTMHPDRMGHLRLSEEETKILNHNFSIIQDCFDQLKKHHNH